MVHRAPHPAPESTIPEAQHGPVVGRFCRTCGAVFSLHTSRHSGKGLFSKDHISSPCSHEGDLFEPGEDWWEPAVTVLPPPAPAEAEGEAAAG